MEQSFYTAKAQNVFPVLVRNNAFPNTQDNEMHNGDMLHFILCPFSTKKRLKQNSFFYTKEECVHFFIA